MRLEFPRLGPHDLEAEQVVLRSMKNGDRFADLTANDFVAPANRALFDVMSLRPGLWSIREVHEVMAALGTLDCVQGAQGIVLALGVEHLSYTPRALDARRAADKVILLAKARREEGLA